MLKLDKVFKINPLYEADGYKLGHKLMLAPGTLREYWTWIPRSLKYMHPSIDKIMSAGQQLAVRYLHSNFKEFFFDQPIEVAEKFGRDMCKYLMMEYDSTHFRELHKLGYLPVKIKALPEGLFTPKGVPHMTGINTIDGYAWLGLYLETLISKISWRLPVVATIAHKFKENAVKWTQKTDPDNLWLTDYMCHDFHSRGGDPFTSIVAGLGHAFSNRGSDTLNVIPASRYYYDVPEDEVCINSVNASEHSVSCTKIFTVGERQMIIDWLKLFPKGILSIVADTFDHWKLIEFLREPEIKELILSREGKVVIRGDSGNPVDILCGKWYDPKIRSEMKPEDLGTVELLWDIFGGTMNAQGYRVLDSHIGTIYGDAINLERQIQIYERLAAKGFACTNTVLGIGSFSYVYMTRDQAGWAAKGAWFEVLEHCLETGDCILEINSEGDNVCKSGECMCPKKKGYEIYKDPITDDGTKKSLKGLCVVSGDKDDIRVRDQQTEEQEKHGMLVTIYEDGVFYNQVTLEEIRERLKI